MPANAFGASSDIRHKDRACGAGMLRQILLLQRDLPKAAKFYQEGLGLPVKVLTERWAEFDVGCTTLALKAVEGFVCCRWCKHEVGSNGCLA